MTTPGLVEGYGELVDMENEALRQDPCEPRHCTAAGHEDAHATASKPFFSTSDNSFSDAPEGFFSPRSHLLTRLLVTFK